MELNRTVIETPPRDAATVVMLRDAPGGLEVFLLKRHSASDVLGGAYVFPGGKIDAEDAALIPQLDQPLAALHGALGEPGTAAELAASCYVAALREAFEESGVLYAHDASAQQVAQATALLREGHGFAEVLTRLGLKLDTRSVLPWSRWVTPRMASVSSRRFDTRFFVAAVPAVQTARHDNHEATESVWVAPRAALEQYRDGHIDLAPPQIMSLAHLARHASVASVLTEARGKSPALVQPEPFDDENGVRVLCYPGDPRHSVSVRALPGPTRLRYGKKRFEPEDGFEALFR
ncbi:MAG: NUDIX hydrolase [Burkholderiales bacterium]|nr:NUDIX hydrolase [Burkholderiales bacterium]